ncbi:MAG: SAM-dependent chlorinase/fluorinase [Anaerolineae bacterium]|nr:SAM-dependent chlorinase/fluorinase [Anaerolineae bacterium]
MAKIITLLTDFGLKDGYPGIMKGVIWTIAPDAHIADLTHSISPQNILEGALALARAAPYFPPETVHIGVVDPGVGTERRPIAAQLGDAFFVGPDNGLFSLLLEDAEQKGATIKVVHLDHPGFWRPTVSSVFHGRDIFAPVGAWLASKIRLEELGTPITDPVRLQIPRPEPIPGGWRGAILHMDHFGNLSTNIPQSLLPAQARDLRIRLGEVEIRGLKRAFGEGKPGELVALVDSAGQLSICVVNGSAAERLNSKIGDVIEIRAQRPKK